MGDAALTIATTPITDSLSQVAGRLKWLRSQRGLTYTVREERITRALDKWLGLLTSPERLDATIAEILTADANQAIEPAHVSVARQRERRLHVELDRMLAAIRAGMDPQLAAPETRKIQADLAEAAAIITAWKGSLERAAALTEDQVREALGATADLVRLLNRADRAERTTFYRNLNLQLRYAKEAPTGLEHVHARLELRSSGGRI